jgi:hypothetical protein
VSHKYGSKGLNKHVVGLYFEIYVFAGLYIYIYICVFLSCGEFTFEFYPSI